MDYTYLTWESIDDYDLVLKTIGKYNCHMVCSTSCSNGWKARVEGNWKDIQALAHAWGYYQFWGKFEGEN